MLVLSRCSVLKHQTLPFTMSTMFTIILLHDSMQIFASLALNTKCSWFFVSVMTFALDKMTFWPITLDERFRDPQRENSSCVVMYVSHGNPICVKTFHSKPQKSNSLWHWRKNKSRITKVMRIYCLENCEYQQFHSNPSNSQELRHWHG